MPTQQDRAIVLRLSDFSETSQIVTLFTRAVGLVRLVAKGVRRSTGKRVAVGLDLLEFGEVVFAPPRRGEGLGVLTEWKQRDAFTDLRAELPSLYAGLYAAELVTFLTGEYDPHPPVFDALFALLRGLAEIDASASSDARKQRVAVALLEFQAAFVSAIGHAPLLEHCTACNRPRPAGSAGFFSSTAGGLVCRDCEPRIREKQRVRGTVIDALQAAFRLTETAAERGARDTGGAATGAEVQLPALEVLNAARRLLDHHFVHIAGRPFELAPRVDKLLRAGMARVTSD